MEIALPEAIGRIALVDTTVAGFLEALYTRRYTGMIVVHCRNGVPVEAVLPRAHVRLDGASPAGGLDTPPLVPDASR